ncbi:hypothetical protein EVAR_48909_1 [Eumeta japonica]|uniref:Endonuclease/exonuclease/phosphatase domain-containing protein n=1 Tax=Eumeta variegata TaxID=151549 RepID=A0A4C1YT35_EUMVA|nr:hypothetical protein EVAR_48909_1 [Eumeta japonica]
MGRDSSVQGGILLAAGALDSQARTELAEGSSAEGNTDHVSLRFIQSNLQRSKLATSELLVEADRRRIAVALVQEPYVGSIGELRRYPGCRVVQKATPRRGPVKAAIASWTVAWTSRRIRPSSTRKRHGCRNRSRKLQDWRCVGVFRRDMPIGPVWGSEHDDARGVDLCDFFDTEGLHILNEGNTPTFEVYRGTVSSGVVDVTACGSALLDRVEEWQVVRDLTSSDHNAVTFAVRMGKRSGPRPPPVRVYTQQRLDGPSSQQPWMLLSLNGL